jgi:hypothetical protein
MLRGDIQAQRKQIRAANMPLTPDEVTKFWPLYDQYRQEASGAPSADTLEGWIKVFEIHGYAETENNNLELEYEKVAIFASSNGPEHVARQKASGVWTSKMGKGVDMEHSRNALEGDFYGKVVKIMKRKCQDGKRVLE